MTNSLAPENPAPPSRVPLWLKVGWTLLAVAAFASYLLYYSFAASFLWFSSIALLLTCVALWLESSFLASMQAVSVALLELSYTVDLVYRLVTGSFLTGLSVYIFQEGDAPLWVRLFSLFHVPLPFLLFWLVSRLGYDRRALLAQIALAWVLLPVCFFLTDPRDNVNWVFGPKENAPAWMPAWGWLPLLMLAFPLLIYVPSHWILLRLFPEEAEQASAG